MKVKVPRKLRAILYIGTVIGSPLIAYLSAKGMIGDLEVTLWLAETTAVAALAGFNLSED